MTEDDRTPGPFQDTWRSVWPPFVISRVLLLVTVYLGLRLVEVPAAPEFWRTFPDHLALDGWARYDSGWLSSVALQGYHFTQSGQNNCGFLPLAPTLARLLSQPLLPFMTATQAFMLALILLSHAAFLVGLLGLYPLAERHVGRIAARRAIVLTCFFPFSFFFACAYTDGVFFCLLVWSFRLAEQERWWPACLLVALNLWCRIPAIFAAVALAAGYLGARGWRIDRGMAPFSLVVASFLALSAFFLRVAGHPLAWAIAQGRWREDPLRVPREILAVVGGTASPAGVYEWSLLILVGGLVSCVPITRRYGASWGLLVLVSLIVPVLTELQALGRYASVLFPLFVLAGERLEEPRLYTATLLLCTASMLTFAYMFSHWICVM